MDFGFVCAVCLRVTRRILVHVRALHVCNSTTCLVRYANGALDGQGVVR